MTSSADHGAAATSTDDAADAGSAEPHDVPDAASEVEAVLAAGAPIDEDRAIDATAPSWPPIDEDSAVDATAPSWPPIDDRGPAPFPHVRTPAGAYLPPSAVLPPLGAPVTSAAVASSRAAGLVALGDRAPRLGVPAWDEVLGSLRLPAGATRTAIGLGAALVSISFLLPWVNGLPGAGLSGYIDRWGLAGSGLWLVFVAAAVLGAIALGSGRPATWPIAVPSIVLGGLVLGLVWSSVFGSRAAVGVWFALAGAIVLVVGGSLDLRSDPDPREPGV
jgi:hypothetical protein